MRKALRCILVGCLLLAFFCSEAMAIQENESNVSNAASDLRGIWSITGIESEQVTMALNEDRDGNLHGSAKYEPLAGDAWNAAVIGTVSGNTVTLVVITLKGDVPESTWKSTLMTGTYNDDALSGRFLRAINGHEAYEYANGDFSAILVNPEISGYTPATTMVSLNKSVNITKAIAPYKRVNASKANIPTSKNQVSPLAVG